MTNKTRAQLETRESHKPFLTIEDDLSPEATVERLWVFVDKLRFFNKSTEALLHNAVTPNASVNLVNDQIVFGFHEIAENMINELQCISDAAGKHINHTTSCS